MKDGRWWWRNVNNDDQRRRRRRRRRRSLLRMIIHSTGPKQLLKQEIVFEKRKKSRKYTNKENHWKVKRFCRCFKQLTRASEAKCVPLEPWNWHQFKILSRLLLPSVYFFRPFWWKFRWAVEKQNRRVYTSNLFRDLELNLGKIWFLYDVTQYLMEIIRFIATAQYFAQI